MKPNAGYTNLGAEFFAFVRFASESIGYSQRGKNQLRIYTESEIEKAANTFIVSSGIVKNALGYMNWRAEALSHIREALMDRDEAEKVFIKLKNKYQPTCYVPMNKQTNDKAHPNFFTGIINILTEANLGGRVCNYNPEKLITFTNETGKLRFTLSRRMDGAYPTLKNPQAFWEIKEYYGTTTFGSRVADGVYETQLDGYETLKVCELTGKKVEHYLFVDDRFTWWEKGKSYLCRLVDLMHMDLATEILFGKEVLTRWPEIVQTW